MKSVKVSFFLILLTLISCDFSGKVIYEETIYGKWRGTKNNITSGTFSGTEIHFDRNNRYVFASYAEDENGEFLGYRSVNFGNYIVNQNEIIFKSFAGEKRYYADEGTYVTNIDDLKSKNVVVNEQDDSRRLNAEFVKNYRTLKLQVPCGPATNCLGIPLLKKVN